MGVDFAGPLYITGQTCSNEHCICLSTCTTTRTVHLELVELLEVEAFTYSFRQFSARRGVTATVLTGNAKTFNGACTIGAN